MTIIIHPNHSLYNQTKVDAFKGQAIKRVEKSQILVLNRVNVSGSGPRSSAKFFIIFKVLCVCLNNAKR